MKTLQNKDLVVEWGRPTKKYGLSEAGWEVAKKVKATTSDTTVSAAITESDRSMQAVQSSLNKVVDFEDVLDDEAAQIAQAIRASLEDHTSQGLQTRAKPRNSQSKDIIPEVGPPLALSQTAVSSEFLELLSSPAVGQSRQSRPWAGSSIHIQDLTTPKEKEQISNQSSARPKFNTTQDSMPLFQPLCLAAGTFTVELVLDNREVRSKTDRDYIQEELRIRGVQPIVRSLDLGDALWVAKCKDPRLLSRLGEEGDEVILDWIVERKRLDDLVSSIKDGRFQEQKFRMHKSGVKNVIYVIEEIAMSLEATQKYHEHVMSAISSTQVVDGYFVKRTRKLDDTIRYLARMTMMLKTLYEVGLHLIMPNWDDTLRCPASPNRSPSYRLLVYLRPHISLSSLLFPLLIT